MTSLYYAEYFKSGVLIPTDFDRAHHLNNNELLSKRKYYLHSDSEKIISSIFIIDNNSPLNPLRYGLATKDIILVDKNLLPTITKTVVNSWEYANIIRALKRKFSNNKDYIEKFSNILDFLKINRCLVINGNLPNDHSKETYLIYDHID